MHGDNQASPPAGELNCGEIFEAISDGLLVFDEFGNIVSVNDAAVRMFGWQRDGWKGLNAANLAAPTGSDGEESFIDRALREGRAIVEQPARRGDGTIFWAEITLHRFSHDQSRKVAATVRNVTDRRQREDDLRNSEEKLSKIFNHSSNAIAFTEPVHGAIVDVNDTWVRMSGIARADALGKTALELGLWARSADREACLAALREHGRIAGYEVIFVMNGKSLPFLVSAERVELRGRPFLLWELRDITDIKRAQEEQERLQRQLQQSHKMESVGRLAGGVAHDFNNNLQVIIGNADMALAGLPPASPVREFIEEIQRFAQRSADLTSQLLIFARKQTIAPRVLRLNHALAEMFKMLCRLIGEDIELVWNPGAEDWPIKIDPTQLDQVLVNLCLNSRDAIAGPGRITIETAACSFRESPADSIHAKPPGDYVALSVSDNGCGMDEHVRRHLFEPFFTTKTVGRGTGLGLATVYGIVRQNHGYIDVQSQPGEGSRFTLYFPRRVGPVEDFPKSQSPGGNYRGSETILLVDDDEAVLNVSQQALEGMGYTVLPARSADAAIRAASEHEGTIQLLITDIVMPGPNGRELARILGERHPALRFLFMSGHTSDVISRHCALDEGLHFIPKPFTVQDLTRRVREIVDLK